MARLRFAKRTINLPASRLARLTIGVCLVVGGFVGFLPILGFWMIPLGLLVLSVDLPSVRRWRRRSCLRCARWLKDHHPAVWRRMKGHLG